MEKGTTLNVTTEVTWAASSWHLPSSRLTTAPSLEPGRPLAAGKLGWECVKCLVLWRAHSRCSVNTSS